ncbi:hypothetical protein FHS43_001728 [Streptosporangium becharense]|uniref:RamC N-terminal domain-containing protein n=1 Tax=Streptosporangium becharense TaxID=1816182 RepID=A0A7W9IN63_9ACTN|nr:lanthionine synthetase LanC family protein [Streptosporangium becharense]MBB2910465.1 hypothetical protein [Streptosporangium becharense]MBB5823208.1 hypothetical protein [Streptosporangium becharense]
MSTCDDDSRFPATRRPLPAGWRFREHDLWFALHPPGVTLPEQGWKIHVSAADADADTVCDLVVDFCLDRNIAVKFLRSRAAMRLLNNKYADRGSSGKLITMYPVDEDPLAGALPALAELLRGFSGPYILSDLRYEDSPVYVRYGGFRRMTYQGPDGEVMYGIRDPDGQLVPDDRSPVFTLPEWVTVPEVLRASVERYGSGGEEEFPWRIERPLHFSNGGGVYLARDKAADGYVVLSEARPYAGLDRDGADAVARLARERDILERLSGLECVPRLLDYTVIWEHHFLVEEYIEGKSLMEEVFERYPLVGPEPSAETLAAYTRWATDVLARIDHALMSIHARGGALHRPAPRKRHRPPGRARRADRLRDRLRSDRPAASRARHSGIRRAGQPLRPRSRRLHPELPAAVDVPADHSSAGAGPGQAGHPHRGHQRALPGAAGIRDAYGAAVRQSPGPLGEDGPAWMFDTENLDWPAIRDSLVAGITASATPDREDRLFPGDPQQFATGGFTVATGAAGVLWAMHQVGAEVASEHVDWLVAAARRATDPRPGLMDGLHGVAATLESLGRRDDALDMLDRARKLHDGLVVPGVHSGLAGAGLNLLHFAETTGDEGLFTEALDIGERLAAEVVDGESRMFRPEERGGLQYGLTGVASYFLKLHDVTGEVRHLDLAGQALRREIDRGQVLPDGTFQLLENNRYLAYLGTGSGGLALVLSQYLARRDEPDHHSVIDGARRASRSPFIRHPALFMGRAGAIATLHLLGLPEDRPVVRGHVRRLAWHALSYQGHLAFPGNQLLRLSLDLETGSAGVLVALSVAFDQSASIIPVLDLRSPALEMTERK